MTEVPAAGLSPEPTHALVAGVDVGGTKVLAVIVDPAQPDKILAMAEAATPAGGGAAALADVIVGLYHRAAGGARAAPTRLGLGLPGLVDRSGVLRYGPHLPGLIDIDFGAWLQAALPVVVTVDNDGNCAALAEATHGAGRGGDAVLFVGLGTGISCGLVLAGELARGGHGFAGEPGHFVIEPSGPLCACGRSGCWETLASGTGLAYLANRRLAADARGHTSPILADSRQLRGEGVTAAWLAGEAWAREVVEEFAGWVARGLAILVAILDPDVVVLGGSMMELGDRLVAPIRRELRREVFRPTERGGPKLMAAALGRKAGAVGAALAAGKLIIPGGTRPQG